MGVWRFGRVVAAVAVLAMLAAVLVGVASTPASAAPAITLSTSTVDDGDTVRVDLTDFPGGGAFRAVGLCPVAALEEPGGPVSVPKSCALLSVIGTSATTATVTVRDANQIFDGAGAGFVCSTLPGGCAIAAADLSVLYEPLAIAWQPITFNRPAWSITGPSEAVAPWQPLTITTQGFPAGPAAIGICKAGAIVPADGCAVLGTYPGGMPAETEVVPPYLFDRALGRASCDRACVLAAWVDDAGPGAPAVDYAALPLTAPEVSVTPTVLADGDAFTVSATGLPPGPVSTVACPSAPTIVVPINCDVVGPATVAPAGTVTFTGVAALPTASGKCSLGACWMGFLVGDLASGFAFTAKVDVDGPGITGAGPGPFESGASLWLQYHGFVGGDPTIAQCAFPLGADLASSRCGPPAPIAPTGTSGLAFPTLQRELVTTSAGTVSCHLPGSCAIVGFRADGRPGAIVPLTFVSGPGITLDPSYDITDGEVMDLVGHDLPAATPVRLVHCLATATSVETGCESPAAAPLVTTDATGALRTPVEAVQRFTSGTTTRRSRHCQATRCAIAVVPADGATIVAKAGYELARPWITATPATGLVDGATVTVAGVGVQATYAGPSVIFPTGGWSVAVCDRSITGAVNLYTVFTKCGVPAGGANVNVTGSSVSVPVTVPARFTTVLGGNTVDCTAAASACVIGLTRWEQDASVSSGFTPLAFG